MRIAELKYKEECDKPIQYSDIKEHLPTLKKYAEECSHITEMGMRSIVSTWAFMVGLPDKLVSYDVDDPPRDRLILAIKAAMELRIDFSFRKEDVLKANIEETDLLFIDTLHRSSQLRQELKLHADKVRKYIIMHDTYTFGEKGEDDNHQPTINGDGLLIALNEFLDSHKEWEIKEVYKNNNGLTVLKRK